MRRALVCAISHQVKHNRQGLHLSFKRMRPHVPFLGSRLNKPILAKQLIHRFLHDIHRDVSDAIQLQAQLEASRFQ